MDKDEGTSDPEDVRGKVLIVYDSSEDVELLATMLTREGYAVSKAFDDAEAHASLASALPDLILLDIKVSGTSGFEVCRTLKENPETCDIPVIFISALGDLESKLRAFDEGAVDYVTKPFHSKEVIARVRAHVTIRKLQEKLKTQFDAQTSELSKVNDAYRRFVPRQFLEFLAKENITDVRLADQVEHEMTVMFTDIRDFTPLSAKMNPQENFNFLNSYLSRVSPVISQHGGFIDKYFGDGIMALFPGLPQDAVTAAVRLQEEVLIYNTHRANNGYDPVRIGTSLHTGTLILGIIGEEHRMEATVIADAVNLASRLESLTKLYGVDILISEPTYNFVREGTYETRWLDEVRVKGRPDSVKLYEVINITSVERAQKLVDVRDTYEASLASYQTGDLAKARQGFEQVLEHVEDDAASRVFLARISHWEEAGLPGDWEGIQTFNH